VDTGAFRGPLNVAVIVVFAFIITVHVVPVHGHSPPDQPEKKWLNDFEIRVTVEPRVQVFTYVEPQLRGDS
jgi:hypothetical protein